MYNLDSVDAVSLLYELGQKLFLADSQRSDPVIAIDNKFADNYWGMTVERYIDFLENPELMPHIKPEYLTTPKK